MTHFKHFLESADINTFSAGIDFRHKNLTFTKDDPRTVTVNKNYNGRWTHNIGIQMERKELTKTFMMNSNWKIRSFSMVYIKKYVSALIL